MVASQCVAILVLGPRGLLEINKGFQVGFSAYMKFFTLQVGVDFTIGPGLFKLQVQIRTPVFLIALKIDVKGQLTDFKNSHFVRQWMIYD